MLLALELRLAEQAFGGEGMLFVQRSGPEPKPSLVMWVDGKGNVDPFWWGPCH